MSSKMIFGQYLFTVVLAVFSSLGVAQEQQPPTKADGTDTSSKNVPKENTPEENTTEKPAKRLPFSHSRAAYPQGDKAKQNLLATYLPTDGMRWLENGADKNLAYWQKDRSGDPKGALLILHAEGASPIWPVLTKPLHDTLPDYGWATLAISLPDPEQAAIAPRTLPVKTLPNQLGEEASAQGKAGKDANDNVSTTQPTTPPAEPSEDKKPDRVPVEQIVESRLEAAMRFLHDRGQFNIAVMADGANAIQAQKFLEKITPKIDNPKLLEDFEKPVRALILVNSRNRLPNMEADFEGWFSDADLPVLDIFIQTDPRNRHDARNRQILARQQNLDNYQQVRMIEFSNETSWSENRLSRRIRSFLVKNVSGIEIKKARIKN